MSNIGNATDVPHIQLEGTPTRRGARRVLVSTVVVGAIAVLWEGAKALFDLPIYKLPHIHQIFAELVRESGDGQWMLTTLLENAFVTAGEAAVGFVFGGLLGFLLAVGFSRSTLMERGLLPYVIASQTVPILAIAPMIVVWLGTTWVSKAVIATYLTFFPVTIHVLRGLRSVERDAVALLESYAATPTQIFFKLRLPASLPYLFTALRISATASVVGAVVGELPVGSQFGMGVVLINAAQYYNWRPAALWAAILVSALMGIGFYALVAVLERLIVTWKPQSERGATP
ncbi:ABC transporter permease [Pendulispora albinea]|uniref:ABC transporter permease n=1 Tax=Pendulispora albinea TaxID=2741071 RepID=A0ABZ2M5E9_9BACT